MATQRRLCIAADIEKWSTRKVPEQIQAQQSLASVTRAACAAAGLPQELAQTQGDGVLLLAPPAIDETAVIPAFVHGLTVALGQENRMLAASARIRLRLSMTTGSITDGPTGFGGPAIVECFRLLDSTPVRAALAEHPDARLALIVSDQLFRDVVQHDFGSLDSAGFWPARSVVKDFAGDAWVTVSGRTGGPGRGAAGRAGAAGPARSAAPGGPDDRGAPDVRSAAAGGDAEDVPVAPEEFARADALSAAGDHDAAAEILERFLREHPGRDIPGALIRLGRVHDRRGDVAKARHTWRYLLETRQSSEACLELGRIERREGDIPLARSYLMQGLRIARREKEPLEPLVDELLELPSAD